MASAVLNDRRPDSSVRNSRSDRSPDRNKTEPQRVEEPKRCDLKVTSFIRIELQNEVQLGGGDPYLGRPVNGLDPT